VEAQGDENAKLCVPGGSVGFKAINSHRQIRCYSTDDKITATKIKHENGFTRLVVDTWEHVSLINRDLPNN